jgi:hypothetical protein
VNLLTKTIAKILFEPRYLCFSLPPVDLNKQRFGCFLYVGSLTRKTSTYEGPNPTWNSKFNILLHGETGAVKLLLYELDFGGVKLDYLASGKINAG